MLVVSEEGGTSATVPLTVWFPQQLSVQVADDTLNRIDGSEACGSSLYQQTEATAVAVFGGEGLVCRFAGQGRLWIQTRTLPPYLNFIQPFRPVKRQNN